MYGPEGYSFVFLRVLFCFPASPDQTLGLEGKLI